MNTIIKATQIDLSDALKEYVEGKMNLLDKYLGRFSEKEEITMKVELARTTNHHNKGEVYYVELNLSIGKKIIRIEQSGEDVREAVDIAKDRMKVEVERYKEQNQPRRGSSVKELAE